ncbi:hypothetical protein OZX73_03480 [Bifidobacterium sp. ESL0775]|uniref:hypothetical protein n=1 Tax=Bifidobacterium sp. ESL0775 TaxID=2983230 RepID=UPI0023F6F96C|nr:hypothetical protein [Bifidobacterium sp. ESL0775]WEV69934.1 hypothetical protein OZX73_03480 [Bifidobacterium sp. ESL0775]
MTERAAKTLVPDIRDAQTHIPASGEGIPTMFAARERNEDGSTRLKLLSSRALLSVPEITHLGGAAKRIGSTLISTLLSAYQGEPIGAANRNEADRYEIPRLGYRLCLITGVQPSNAGVLLDEAGSGLPQRFLWFDVLDPETPLDATPTRRVLDSLTCFPYDTSKLPADPDMGVMQAYCNPGSDGLHKPNEYPRTFRHVGYPPLVADEFDYERIRTNHGALANPLDAHRLLVTSRVAALLALLDRPGEMPVVTELEWRNAKTVMEHSATYRAKCIRDMKTARSHLKADELEINDSARGEVRERGIDNAKGKVLDYLEALRPSRKGVKGWKIRQNIARSCRQYTYPALADLRDEGQIAICGDDTGKESANSWRLR